MMTIKTAACQAACPAGVDVPRYLRHIRDGEFGKALAVVRERIAFPLVCGHACFHPCERKCGRRQYDAPLAIRMLKRVAAEQGALQQALPKAAPATGRKVAIVGSGPCGLTAGYELALKGHGVTVFEALDRSGGMLRFGIPAYRLSDEIVDADIGLIEQAGVQIRTGTRVASPEALLAQGFDAVLIASGAWRSAKMDIPVEDGATVLDGLAFLAGVSKGAAPNVGQRVVVVGGGNTAIDAARVSRRLGAEVVQLYRRTRAQMPAAEEEIAAALEEGVAIDYLCAPLRVAPGQVTCIRMELGPADASGRPRPVAIEGSEFVIAADSVIAAIGQEVDIPGPSIATDARGTAAVDRRTLATSVAGVFAGGDAVLGPASIIDAIAQGRQAAGGIDRFLGGDGVIDRDGSADDPEVAPVVPRGAPRQSWGTLPRSERLNGFALVEEAYGKEAAAQEAMRCLSCDARTFEVAVDAATCKDCGYCSEVCEVGVFTRSDQFNAGGYQPAVAARPEQCVGCLNCLYICPDLAITVTQQALPQ